MANALKYNTSSPKKGTSFKKKRGKKQAIKGQLKDWKEFSRPTPTFFDISSLRYFCYVYKYGHKRNVSAEVGPRDKLTLVCIH